MATGKAMQFMERLKWRGEALNDASPAWQWIGGIAFTFAIAWIGYGVSELPGPDRVGQLACAILISVAYRQLFGYPDAIRAGIQFSSRSCCVTPLFFTDSN